MRVILDECVPKRLGREFVGHDVTTVPQAGWASITNGELLRRIAGAYDAFVTMDGNLPHQQNLAGHTFGVIVLRSPSNRIGDLRPLAPKILTALASLVSGQVVFIER